MVLILKIVFTFQQAQSDLRTESRSDGRALSQD